MQIRELKELFDGLYRQFSIQGNRSKSLGRFVERIVKCVYGRIRNFRGFESQVCEISGWYQGNCCETVQVWVRVGEFEVDANQL